MSEENKKVEVEIETLGRKEKKALKALEEQVAKLTEQVTKLNEDLDKAKKEVDEWKNKYYGVYADMDNARKQNEKDRIQFIKYRAMGFVEKLLPVLDGFHFATLHMPEDEVLKNYLQGFKTVYKQLVDALASEGVTEIAPKQGDDFDIDTMYAVDTEYVADAKPNVVSKVFTNGYMLHDRLVRAATVVTTTDQKPVTEEAMQAEQPEDKDLN